MTGANPFHRQGYEAGATGAPLSANPHPPDLNAHRAWRAGWLERERDEDDASGDLFRGTAGAR